MTTLLRVSVLIISLFLSITAMSQVAGSQDEGMPSSEITAYYMAIKGGISLGSYETGVNRAILKYIEKKDRNAKIVSFSGASAGSVNAVLSAIDTCIVDKKTKDNEVDGVSEIKDTLDSNFMQTSWDIGIDGLVQSGVDDKNKLSTKSNDEDSYKEAGMFSRVAFKDKKELLKILSERTVKYDCKLTITMSVTKFEPIEYMVNEIGAVVQLQRFVVPIDVLVDSSKKLIFKNSKLDDFKYKKPGVMPSTYLNLVTNKDGNIDFDDVWNLAMASSAFPLAFHPVELSFCFPHVLKDQPCKKGNATTALFSDGGLFDNSPIGVAWDIANPESGSDKFKNKKLIYINPDSYRTNDAVIKRVNNKQNIGLSEYGGYFADSLLTAHESVYKSSIEKIFTSGSETRIFYMTNRYHNLLADLHAHFGAFYAKEYRMHDYLVGVYDGFHIAAQLDCDEKQDEKVKKKKYKKDYDRFKKDYRGCVQQQVLVWIESHETNNPKNAKTSETSAKNVAINAEAINFIKYLYDSEYDESLLSSDMKINVKNKYIALSRSFGVINKNNLIHVDYAGYLKNLKTYLKGSVLTDLNIKKDDDLFKILNNGKTYTSEKISGMYKNIIQMQDLASDCVLCVDNSLNKGLGTIFKVAEPVVDSYLSHYESNIWPKPLYKEFGFSYGFNINQKNHVYSIDWRPEFFSSSSYKSSIDFSLNYHDFGAELNDDDYGSYSVGLIKHESGIGMPTWGVGYQHETKGENIYDSSLASVFVKMSFLNEIVSLKYLHRLDDVKKFSVVSMEDSHKQFSVSTREDNVWVISFDISKIFEIAKGFSAKTRTQNITKVRAKKQRELIY